MKSFNANLKRIYVLLVCFLLLFGLQAGIGLAQSVDKSSITHTFHNTHPTNTYNDLHIEYTKMVDVPASNPKITPAGGANVTGWTRKGTNIDILGSFPPGSSVKVKAYSAMRDLKVKQYWWTIGGNKVGPKIPVYYVTITAGKKGAFKFSKTFNKPIDTVKVTITGAVNIVGGKEGVDVEQEAVGSKTKITFSGTLINPKQKGRVTAIIDPPDEIIDLVLEIVPPEEVPAITPLSFLLALLSLFGLGAIAMRKMYKK